MNAFEECWYILKQFANPPKRQFDYLGTVDGRDIGVLTNTNAVSGKVMRFPHYRSSGQNSGEAGSWKPFRGITTQPQEVEIIDQAGVKFKRTPDAGWVIKPQLTDSDYLSEDYMSGDNRYLNIKYPDKRARYGHPAFEEKADWMNENVGAQKFEQKIMTPEQINQALIDANAVNLHAMAQGVQQPAPANSLQAQRRDF